MKKLKNLFRNLFIIVFRVKFVLVSIRDHSISVGKSPNTIYPGRDSFIKIEVPLSKLIDFRINQYEKNIILLDYEKTTLAFDVVSVEYVYDLMSGSLEELIIYSNLSKK